MVRTTTSVPLNFRRAVNHSRVMWLMYPMIVVSSFTLLYSQADAGSSPGTKTPISFEEIASKSQLNFTTRNSPTDNKNQPETMVAGVALLDYDGDGFLDIYLFNGAAILLLQKDSAAYW